VSKELTNQWFSSGVVRSGSFQTLIIYMWLVVLLERLKSVLAKEFYNDFAV
jgi:hypothetical protein